MARAEALALALDEARSRAGADRLAGIDGVLGTLLDLVEIDEGWEAAFEAAAGEALAAVVVDEVDAGPPRRSHALARRRRSPARCWPWARRRPSRPPPPVGEPLRRHVRAVALATAVRPDAVDALLDALVGATVVVAGRWAEALDVALAASRRRRS